ncbi:MAG: dicarboxylate/amino acid:cation symporter [Alphaproteobacteria bacterium]|nr:dicarboxylate/amino acid:cation symporter [Alphaproteobacteria bacterium]
MAKGMTIWVLAAMALGIAFGLACNVFIHDRATIDAVVANLNLLTTIFLRAIRMIIAPLVLATLVGGVGRIRDAATIGRIALAAMAWFVLASLAAVLVALVAAMLLTPGAGMHLTAAVTAASGAKQALTLAGFIEHLVPVSILDAMARNEILQIVVFSLVAGVALSRMGPGGDHLLALADSLAQLMLKMTGYVMWLAPVAVFAAVGGALAKQGVGLIARYAGYVGGFYLALAVMALLLLLAGWAILGRGPLARLMIAIRQPALIAFTTASSEAVYPSLLARLEDFGVPNRIAALVLPLGYSFNLVGSMCYCVFASLFVAQAYDIVLPPGALAEMLFLLFILSKGIAGVPRAGLLIVAAVMPYFQIPEAGLVLILGVDHFVDMGRTAMNAIANGLAAASVAKWEARLP